MISTYVNQMGSGSLPGVRCGLGVTLTPHPLLVPRSKIEYSYEYTYTLPKGLRGLWKGETYLHTWIRYVHRSIMLWPEARGWTSKRNCVFCQLWIRLRTSSPISNKFHSQIIHADILTQWNPMKEEEDKNSKKKKNGV